jgi:hypothetical protein
MSLTGELWEVHAKNDLRNRELVKMPEGQRVTYEELLASADPSIAKKVNIDTFKGRVENIQKGLDELDTRFGQTDMDVMVMFGDDQGEFFFEDNYPSINLYWGESIKLVPRPIRDDMTEAQKMSSRAYGAEEKDWPVDSKLGLHLIESLMEDDFDIAHSRYLKETYGGRIGPATWYLDMERSTAPRPFGLQHAFGFGVARWFHGKTVPVVPITINTCYPPNWISPRRAYALGRAVRRAVESWAPDKKVAFGCTGGLSHFVVDEELDRQTLKGLETANGEVLTSLPRHRLQSATTEILNWVAVQGAMGDTKMETITYEPGYRTPAGTGCGCAVGHWGASNGH